jgi:hypothetical protein
VSDPRLAILRDVLDARRAELAAALHATPTHARERRPSTDAWSVAMTLEHLADTERAIARLLAAFVRGAPPRGEEEPFDPSGFAERLAMPVFLDRRRKLKLSQPSGALSSAEAWNALVRSRAELLDVLAHAGGLRLEDVAREHPAGLALDGYQWAAFVGLHEARHAAQILEIRTELIEGEQRRHADA